MEHKTFIVTVVSCWHRSKSCRSTRKR